MQGEKFYRVKIILFESNQYCFLLTFSRKEIYNSRRHCLPPENMETGHRLCHMLTHEPWLESDEREHESMLYGVN